MVRPGDREQSGKFTLWLRSRGAGDWNDQGADGENPDGEEGESSFGEHNDMGYREDEEIMMALGLKLGR